MKFLRGLGQPFLLSTGHAWRTHRLVPCAAPDAGDDQGEKPQESGGIPAPAGKPAHTIHLSGTLAETGSSSAGAAPQER
ncbi:hypothetical protein ACFPN0_20280 [Kitasatospora cinereorecta]